MPSIAYQAAVGERQAASAKAHLFEKCSVSEHREDYGTLVSEIHRVSWLQREATRNPEGSVRDAVGHGWRRMGEVQEMPSHLCSIYR